MSLSLISPLLEVGALSHWPHWLSWDYIVGFCLLWRSSTAGAIARPIRKHSDNIKTWSSFLLTFRWLYMVWLLTDFLWMWCVYIWNIFIVITRSNPLLKPKYLWREKNIFLIQLILKLDFKSSLRGNFSQWLLPSSCSFHNYVYTNWTVIS